MILRFPKNGNNEKRPPDQNGGLIRLYMPVIKVGAITAAIGLVYYLFIRLTGLAIPCVFHLVTRLYCPGCGITRAFIDLFALDFKSALTENLAITILAPVWLIVFIIYLTKNKTVIFHRSKTCNTLAIISLVILLIFGVLRNLPGFEMLLPNS